MSRTRRLTTTPTRARRLATQVSRGDLDRVRGVDVDRVLRDATVDDGVATVGEDGAGEKSRADVSTRARLRGDADGERDDESAGVARGAVEGRPATKKGRGIVARSAMPSWQLDPCRGARFGLRQGRAALLPLSRSGHG